MYRKDSYWEAIRGFSIMSLFAFPLLACGLMVTLQALGEWAFQAWLDRYGERTEATIVRLREDDLDGITYYLEYEYWVDRKRYKLQAREEVSPYMYKHAEVGETVPIRYSPWFSHWSRIEGNTYQRNYLSVIACWGNVFGLTLGLLLLVARRAPTTDRGKRRVATLFNGGCVMTAITLLGWLVELAVVKAVGVRQGVAGLGIGLIAGLVAAVLTWQPWHKLAENDPDWEYL